MELPGNLRNISDWCLIVGAVISTLSVLLYVLFSLYRKIRYSIPASVNCWFCNKDAKVAYALRNSWTCPGCQQYNGFSLDGNYNKRISAQFIEALNRPIRGSPPKGFERPTFRSNGLCSQCNLNQELQVFQLSSFVPNDETNFDVEVEKEQKRLEEIYDLCSPCKVVVQRTLMTKSNTSTKERIAKHQNQPLPVQQVPVVFNKSNLWNMNQSHFDSSFGSSWSSDKRDGKNLVSYSDVESDSDENNLHMEKLRIGSHPKPPTISDARISPEFGPSVPILSTPMHPPASSSPLMPFLPYSANNSIGFNQMRNKNFSPLWSDYPMDRNSPVPILSPSYSFCDGMINPHSKSIPSVNPASFFNYRSSSVANIFGGRKSLLSPPKLGLGNTGVYPSFSSYGLYYGYGTSEIFIPPFFGSPVSRSSSQSSGFISQRGINTPPPSTFSTAQTSMCDPDRNSILCEPTFGQNVGIRQNVSPSSCISPCPRVYTPETTMERIDSANAGSKIFVSGNTCSRFGPRSDRQRQHSTDETIFSDDEEESACDSHSFKSTVTSSSALRSRKSSRVSTKKSSLGHDDMFCKEEFSAEEVLKSAQDDRDTDNILGSNIFVESRNFGDRCRYVLYHSFVSVSLFLNVVFMFWLFFGNDFHELESTWFLLKKFSANATDFFATDVPAWVEDFQTHVTSLLAAKTDSRVSQTVVFIDV